MGTLGGFPNPPALWLRRAKLGSAYAIRWEPWAGSQTLPRSGSAELSSAPPTRSDGNPGRVPKPALWLRRAKPDSAYAVDRHESGNPEQIEDLREACADGLADLASERFVHAQGLEGCRRVLGVGLRNQALGNDDLG
jgi:hypothetical protein